MDQNPQINNLLRVLHLFWLTNCYTTRELQKADNPTRNQSWFSLPIRRESHTKNCNHMPTEASRHVLKRVIFSKYVANPKPRAGVSGKNQNGQFAQVLINNHCDPKCRESDRERNRKASPKHGSLERRKKRERPGERNDD